MDVQRDPREKQRRQRRRIAGAVALLVVGIGATYALAQLQPAAPVVDKAGAWIDSVQRGSMVIEVRGAGRLVPDEFVWLAAETDGRVDRVVLRGGAVVAPDTVILRMSNPEAEQASTAAMLALQGAEAAYRSLESSLRNELLQQRASAAVVESDHEQAVMQSEVDQSLARDGLLAQLTARQSAVRATSLSTRLALERERLKTSEDSLETRLSVQRAEIDNRRSVADLRRRDVGALAVLASMHGVLQEVAVDEGQRVARGTNLARVANPSRLKVELRIAETQTKELRIGLPASIDTHNGIIAGHVARIDPAAQNGTVTVDVTLDGDIPPGARPDMTVDGVIEIDRLDNVLHVGRPAINQLQGSISVFRVMPNSRAVRTTIQVGRVSTNRIEVTGGLDPGDQIILSDTSTWDGQDAIVLR